jgi:hypothetical protein
MSSQTTSTVFMVKPVCFGFNEQTAENNAFQKEGFGNGAQEKALGEFNEFVTLLKNNGINVVEAEDTLEPKTPDSIFPNNWFSTHPDGILVLYPMFAPNRRDERKQIFIDTIKKNFETKKVVDLTKWEKENKFLEGTGSMVLDRVAKVAYACKSPRTHEEVFNDFCKQLGYKPVLFNAVDKNDKMIYHTNVLMCIGSTYAVVCTDSIKDKEECKNVKKSLEKSGKKIVEISFDQMEHFAGNMLEVKNKEGKRFLIMSQTAFDCLKDEQKNYLEKECTILHPKIECVEVNGGGSARCMMAELY